MDVLKIDKGDVLILKKAHPCKSDSFEVIRVGSDIRMICCGCKRDLSLTREKVEKCVKRIIKNKDSV